MTQVLDVVASELNVQRDEISVCLRLVDVGVDSLDRLSLAMRLEESFGVVLQDNLIQRLRTVGDVVELIAHAKNRRDQQGAS